MVLLVVLLASSMEDLVLVDGSFGYLVKELELNHILSFISMRNGMHQHHFSFLMALFPILLLYFVIVHWNQLYAIPQFKSRQILFVLIVVLLTFFISLHIQLFIICTDQDFPMCRNHVVVQNYMMSRLAIWIF